MNPISPLFSFLLVAMVAHGAPLGNSMIPEHHATALVPMITGTNVPESAEEIEAPIDDSREVEKIKALAHNVAENAKNPEGAPVVGDFLKANPGILSSTLSSGKVSGTDNDMVEVTTVEAAFTLGGHPTLASVLTTSGNSGTPSGTPSSSGTSSGTLPPTTPSH